MKSKNRIKLISSILFLPIAINASDAGDKIMFEGNPSSNHTTILPNEELIIDSCEGQFLISYNKIFQLAREKVQVEEDMPMEILIHEETTSIDIILGDISVTVPIERASRHTLNVITRNTHDFKSNL